MTAWGEQAIGAVVDEFYDRVLADGAINRYFADHDLGELRTQLKRYAFSLTGGQIEHIGEDFDAVAYHLDDAMRHFDVIDSKRAEVLDAIGNLKPEVVSHCPSDPTCLYVPPVHRTGQFGGSGRLGPRPVVRSVRLIVSGGRSARRTGRRVDGPPVAV